MKTADSKKESSLSSPLLLLFLVALLVRGVVLFANPSSFDADPDQYMAFAENWYSYGVFGRHETPSAFRPPLYPAILKELILIQASSERPKIKSVSSQDKSEKRIVAPSPRKVSSPLAEFFDRNVSLSRNASVALLHWILGVATALFVWLYARRVGLSPVLALLAGILVVFDPILLQQSRLVMTETTAAFFSALLLLVTTVAVQKRDAKWAWLRYALVGAAFGLATLCRPTFYVFAGLVLLNLGVVELASLIQKTREKSVGAMKSFGAGLLRVACFALGIALVVAPWALRNYKAMGKPILATTHGGYTLYLANNPEIYAHYRSSSPFSLWNPQSFHERSLKELESEVKSRGLKSETIDMELFTNESYREKALETIRADRCGFYYSCLIRACELWRFLPNDVSSYSDSPKNEREKLFAGVPQSKIVDIARHAIAVFYLLEFFFALLGCLALRLNASKSVGAENDSKTGFFDSPLIWGFLLLLSVQLPHMIYWTNMRMRAPLEVFVPILAVVWLRAIFKKRSCAKP